MKKFEALTLEEAYAEAAKFFACSITELEIQIIQNPSKGFLGIGRKPAIIVAQCNKKTEDVKDGIDDTKVEQLQPKKIIEEKSVESLQEYSSVKDGYSNVAPFKEEDIVKKDESNNFNKRDFQDKEREIFDNFYIEKPDINTVIEEVKEDINNLFSLSCFNLEPISVSKYDEETIFIEIKGEDAALLIGKEGYRYKALSYLIYNWISSKYGYRVRLEIAEFLKNQELMIENYLQPIIEQVKIEGRAQTKVLDGILVQIALKRLREIFPNKYVAIRLTREGGKYIIIDEFMERR